MKFKPDNKQQVLGLSIKVKQAYFKIHKDI